MRANVVVIAIMMFLTGCVVPSMQSTGNSANSEKNTLSNASYKEFINETEYCVNIDSEYPGWQAAFGPVGSIKEYEGYYQVCMNVVTDHFHKGNESTVPVTFRIRKDAEVIWWTGESANEVLSLDEYAKKYGADRFINTSLIRMWPASDQDSAFQGVEQDENGYIVQLFDGEFS